ncbi:MAG TPA: DUF6502 family protein [Woeseiaceae bacterium]|nr:DUF6502 family protein [Woeseiaceae bacterium]
MSDSLKAGLLAAYSKLLRPLIRILLRHGITYAELSEVVKTVYVSIAANEFRVPGKKMSKARIAIVTGLTRKEVQRISELDSKENLAPKTNLSRIGRVLSGWHTDPDFTGPYGMPLEIRYDSDLPADVTFSKLVQRYSGDMTPRAMLDELVRVGAVVETDQGWFKVLRREYVPQMLDPDFLERVGRGVHNFVHTIEMNMQKAGPGKGRFERTVRPDSGLRTQDLPSFDQYVRQKGQAFLEDIDNWMTKLEQPKKGDEVIQTGVGIYHFVVEDDEYDQKNIKEFLEERSGTE